MLLSLLASLSLFSISLSTAVLAPKRDVLGAWGFAACSVGFGANGLLNAFWSDRFAKGLLGVGWAVFPSPSFDGAGDAPKIDPNCGVFAGTGVCSSLVTFGAKTLLAADCSFPATGVPNMGLNGLSSAGFAPVLSATGFGENILPNAGEGVCSFSASETFDTAGVPNMDLNGWSATGFAAVFSAAGFGENILPNAGAGVCSFPASETFDAAGVPNIGLNGCASATFPALSVPVTFGEDKVPNELGADRFANGLLAFGSSAVGLGANILLAGPGG